jgi:sigma-B regulation protein RsbU (phosphoserine phosphatase)
VRDSGSREDVVVPVAPGDTLLLYTDGVTETPGDGERFGEQRLRAAIDAAPAGADALLRALAADLDAFERGTSLDDLAMLALRRVP